MTMKERYKELTTAIGTWPEVTEKVNNAWTTISNTFNRGGAHHNPFAHYTYHRINRFLHP